MRGVNLNVFDFDFDLEWAAFFLNADETIYGRFGGQKADAGDTYLTLPALRHAMEHALEQHRQAGKRLPKPATPPEMVEQYPAAKRLAPRACIHCHQVYDFRREEQETAGTFRKDDLWVYPLPENLGLTMIPDQGNRVKAVKLGSLAAGAGLQPGDVLTAIAGRTVASVADVQYALHRAPEKGMVPISWRRANRAMSADLPLPEGWRVTDISWRASTKRIGPEPSVYGEDLTAEEKQALGLAPQQLAFRQENFVSTAARQAGIRRHDIILGIDQRKLDMTAGQFLTYVRLNYRVGDQVTFQVLREGQRIEVPLTLPRRAPQ